MIFYKTFTIKDTSISIHDSIRLMSKPIYIVFLNCDTITTAIKSQCFNSRSLEYISTFYVEKNKIPFHCVFVNNA